MFLLFLVSWLVLSVVGGIVVGKAIHRADVMELRQSPYRRPAPESPEPGARTITTSAVVSPSRPISPVPVHVRAA
jgi:hypothetical protein